MTDTIGIGDACDNYNKFPQVLPAQDRIIAIGDVHGDMDHLLYLLKIARVINDDNEWDGGNTYVIQLGDEIDSCRPQYNYCSDKNATPNDKPNDIQIIEFLDDLHIQAQRKKGAVISLLGNHEIMNIDGDMRYVSYENLKDAHGMNGRKKLFSHDGKIGHKLICTHPASIIIGSNLFVHAGILPKIIDIIPDLRSMIKDVMHESIMSMTPKNTINYMFSKILQNKLDKKYLRELYPDNTVDWDNISVHQLRLRPDVLTKLLGIVDKVKECLIKNIDISDVDNMHPLEVINTVVKYWLMKKISDKYASSIDTVNSMFLNRILGNIPNEKHKNVDRETCEKYVDPVLKFFNINHMVIGHTPQFMANQSGINTACDSKLTRIDIGGADAFNLFDSTFEKTGNRMRQRVPQILEILNDTQSRILYDEKYNNMHGGMSCDLYKHFYYT